MRALTEFLNSLAENAADFAIYCAIALVALIGVTKCVLPVSRGARRLRRGIRLLETNTGEGRPVWQDVMFLGKELQGPWRRFLVNAEQLDARGLNCNVGDYINDDSVIYSAGHEQLAEVVPSLLTSLGILGTFIGLMRGLGGLDVSDAAKTMESIPQMIGGMTFAFMTSIAGIACSLIFNMLSRMAHGSATRAIDEFHDAFSDLVMQKPLEDNVQIICQQEDRSALLRRLSADMGARVSDGIVSSVERSLAPVTQSMNSFILGQTQAQIDGVANIASQFVTQMNRALGGQFAQLGQTLSQVNQAQAVSYESMERTMAAAGQILDGMRHVQDVTERVMQRFESYIGTIQQAQQTGDEFVTHGSQVLSGMITASREQTELLTGLQSAQQTLNASMREYADWSGRVLTAVQEQSGAALSAAGDISARLDDSSRRLSETYSDFVDDLSAAFGKSMGMFDENITSVLKALQDKLDDLKAAADGVPGQGARLQKETEACASAISQLQRAVTDLTKAMNREGA